MTNTIQYNGYTWTDNDLKAISANLDTSLTGRELDVDTATFVVECSDDLSGYLQDTPVRFLRGGSQYALWYVSGVTRIAPKLWQFSLISSLGRLAQLGHRGGVYGNANSGTTRRVLSGDLIREICGYVNGAPTAVTVYVSPEFENTVLYGWLPNVAPSGNNGAKQGSAKDNLLQLLFALNATIRTDANGVLRVENLSTSVSSVIDDDKVYLGNAAVRHEPPVTSLTLIEHAYSVGTGTRELFSGSTATAQEIAFDEPMTNLAADGLTIVESGANYAIVTGTGTLTGIPYAHTMRDVTSTVTSAVNVLDSTDFDVHYERYEEIELRKNETYYFYVPNLGYFNFSAAWDSAREEAYGNVTSASIRFSGGQFVSGSASFTARPVTAFGVANLRQGKVGTNSGMTLCVTSKSDNYVDTPISTPNEIKITEATLVSFSNVADVADRLTECYQHRTWIEEDVIVTGETCGDVLSIFDPFDKVQRTACLERIQPLQFSNVAKGRVSALIGYSPWQVVPFEDVRLVLTGSGSWTVPAGVSSIRVVLIGGGDGGRRGEDGAAANVPTPRSSSSGDSDATRKSVALPSDQCLGGVGGAAGEAGDGGKVLVLTLSVSAGDVFAYSAGPGGAGATAAGVDGSAGTATTFGSFSSADGESTAEGYYDAVEDTVFAARGAPGIRGGDGSGRRNGEEYTSPDITVGDINYSAGARDSTVLSDERGSYNTGSGSYEAYATGGYGGGPAFGSDGAAGSAPDALDVRAGTDGYAFAYAAPGGDGAAASAPQTPTVYGKGGPGGNGGGGGGAYGWKCFVSNTVGRGRTGGTINVIVDAEQRAKGGEGSRGGDGAPGCVIITLRQPVNAS